MLVAAPPPLVEVRPTTEVRTIAPVNRVAVDGGRAATIVGESQSWEYVLVWSPKGVVARNSIACDTQESNLVLAGNRLAHVCYQSGFNYTVTGTVRPVTGRVALRSPGTSLVSLAGRGRLVTGTAGSSLWRFDRRTRTRLRTYPTTAIALDVDGSRILVDRSARVLDVVSSAGRPLVTLRLPHAGGALMRNGRIAAISGRRLVVSDLRGRPVLTRAVAPGAHLEDFDGRYAVYTVETRLHLLRLADGRDRALRLRGQFGYASAELADGALFYAYNVRSGRQLGRAGFVAAPAVRALFRA